jgi:small subunit ribosomal protein S16
LIGTYNPKAGQIAINGEKAKHWLSQGVQASDTVHNMLVSQKIIDAKKRNALPKKSPILDEAKVKAEAEAKARVEADKLAAAAAEKAAAEAALATTPVPEVAVEEVLSTESSEAKEAVTA